MTEPRQYILPLLHRVSLDRENYFVSDSNAAALAMIERWPAWPNGMLAIVGAAGSGKTHLASVHAARVSAAGRSVDFGSVGSGHDLLVEDIDRLAGDPDGEVALFHAFHRIVIDGGSILFTSRVPMAGLKFSLADLRTRLNTVTVVDLPPPDDALLMAVLMKLFADRQIDPERAAAVSAWAVPRMPRSLASASALVDALDRRSLAQKRRIDSSLAAEILSPELDL